MTTQETAPGAPEVEQQEQQPQTPGESKPQEGSEQEAPKTYDEATVKELRREAAAARTKNKSLESELEKVRQANMSTDERLVAEAEQRGRSAAAADFGTRLARKEFDALAGRRNPEARTDELLEYVDLSKFVGDDGEPDVKAIQAAVERLVPQASDRPPSFDGGTRTAPNAAQSFNDILRKQAGR